MDADRVAAEWVRGVLPLCALAALAGGEAHGYAIVIRLADAGVGQVKGGAMYPVLNRLETEGAVTSAWRDGVAGPGRKVFVLTEDGRRRLLELTGQWRSSALAVGRLLPAGAEVV